MTVFTSSSSILLYFFSNLLHLKCHCYKLLPDLQISRNLTKPHCLVLNEVPNTSFNNVMLIYLKHRGQVSSFQTFIQMKLATINLNPCPGFPSKFPQYWQPCSHVMLHLLDLSLSFIKRWQFVFTFKKHTNFQQKMSHLLLPLHKNKKKMNISADNWFYYGCFEVPFR